MRRALLASGALSLGFAAFSGVAQASDIYNFIREEKATELDNGNYLVERYVGVSKYNFESTKWGSIFDNNFEVLKQDEQLYSSSDKSVKISERTFRSTNLGGSYVGASGSNL